MGFLFSKPKLKTPKKSPNESRGDPQNKTPKGILNRKIGQVSGEGQRTTVPYFWHGGAASCRPFLPSFFVLLARLRSFSRLFARLKSITYKNKQKK